MNVNVTQAIFGGASLLFSFWWLWQKNQVHPPLSHDLIHPLKYSSWYSKKTENDPIHQKKEHIFRGIEPIGPSQRDFLKFREPNFQNSRLKFLTYNILMDIPQNEAFFPYTPPCFLNFDYRSRLILKEIIEWNPDIFTLQEVTHFDWFDVKFQDYGYTGIFQQRPNGKPDGCSIFWRNDKYSQKGARVVNFNDLIPKNSNFEEFYKKDNVGIIISLRDNKSKRDIIIATAHLYYHPGSSDLKLVQAWQFLKEIELFMHEHFYDPSTPIIFAGDLNSVPSSAVYEFLSKGTVPKDHVDMKNNFPYGIEGNFSTNLKLYSAYQLLNHPITNFTPRFSDCLDYIFVSNLNINVTHLAEIISMDSLNSNHFAAPSSKFPSDHFSLIAELEVG